MQISCDVGGSAILCVGVIWRFGSSLYDIQVKLVLYQGIFDTPERTKDAIGIEPSTNIHPKPKT